MTDILLLISGLFGIGVGLYYHLKDREHNIISLFIVSGIAIGIAIASIKYEFRPKAIDVYRDKTTLEITYKDGVPVDSIVVFKDKEK